MVEPTDMILPILRDMRADNAAARKENAKLHEQTREMIGALNKRMDGMERAQKNFSSALAADTLLSRILTGEFEQRIEALERKMQELEAR